MMSVYFI